jgi:nucleoside-diphosphate-sugar epimerase
MKVILTGATGFVGSEIVAQLLERSEIDEVTCLTRRPVNLQSPKLRTILHDDFTRYNKDLATKLAEHSACIWALGGKASDASNPVAFERATHTFTISFACAVAEGLHQPFRFCYLSGMGADPSETSTFPWEKMTRHLKGRTERDLDRLTEQHRIFRATSFRPAGILPKSTSAVVDRLLAPIAIRVDRLAKIMIDESISTAPVRYRVLSNKTIREACHPHPQENHTVIES